MKFTDEPELFTDNQDTLFEIPISKIKVHSYIIYFTQHFANRCQSLTYKLACLFAGITLLLLRLVIINIFPNSQTTDGLVYQLVIFILRLH